MSERQWLTIEEVERALTQLRSKQNQPLLLKAEEAGQLLGIGRSKVFLMMASGELPGVVRLGRSVRISREALERWVRDRSVERQTPPNHLTERCG